MLYSPVHGICNAAGTKTVFEGSKPRILAGTYEPVRVSENPNEA